MLPHRLALALAACCAAVAVHAQPGPQAPAPAVMTKDAFKAQKRAIEATYDAAQARCKATKKGHDRDVCLTRVRGERDVSVAELDMRYKPSAKADEKLREARADATFAVAREQCELFEGGARDVCRKDAKAVQAQAYAEAKLQTQVAETNRKADATVQERTTAQAAQMEAQFAAARERCDMLQGPAREDCMINARKRFGKL